MISKNIFKIFLTQISRKLNAFLENGGFKNSRPLQMAINGGKLNIYMKSTLEKLSKPASNVFAV